MRPVPVVITITDLRRNATRIIEAAARSRSPVYVTQYGYAMAVLLPRERYDELLRAESVKADTTPDVIGRVAANLASDRASERYWRREQRQPLAGPEVEEAPGTTAQGQEARGAPRLGAATPSDWEDDEDEDASGAWWSQPG